MHIQTRYMFKRTDSMPLYEVPLEQTVHICLLWYQ